MATGGRVLHHLRNYLSHRENVVRFAGFQAAGTRGRALVEGQKTIKMHGVNVPVVAQVLNMESLSAHAVADEIISWLEISNINPRKVFITHGEKASSESVSKRLNMQFQWECCIPKLGDSFSLR